MERKNYTVAVDLGSSNVVVAVGEKNAEERLDVVCVVSKPVEGVNAGKIENIELVSRAIREAVSEAEEQLGIRITEAYAGISGDFVRCARSTRAPCGPTPDSPSTSCSPPRSRPCRPSSRHATSPPPSPHK